MDNKIRAIRILVFIIIGTCLAGCSKAEGADLKSAGDAGDQPVTLSIHWSLDKTYQENLDVTQSFSGGLVPDSTNVSNSKDLLVDGHSKINIRNRITVTKQFTNGGYELALQFLSQKMLSKTGDQILMDYDSTVNSSNYMVLRKMIGKQVHCNVDAGGNLQDVTDWSDYLKQIGSLKTSTGKGFSVDSIRQHCDFGGDLPDHPVRKGDQWICDQQFFLSSAGTVKTHQTNMFMGVESHQNVECARVDIEGEILPAGLKILSGTTTTIKTGSVHGTEWFDIRQGMLVERVLTHEMNLKAAGAEPGERAGFVLSQTAHLRLVTE